MINISSIVCLGFLPKGQPVVVVSPVDQLLPTSKRLVEKVEETLRKIVQMAIERSLFKFPTLKQAVEAKVVNNIFERKRDQTIQFIQQFIEMQKKSIDQVFAPVPTPQQISQWESYPMKKHDDFHPCMISKTMSHMKNLSRKLYPEQMVREIESHASGPVQTSFLGYKVSIKHKCQVHIARFRPCRY